MARNILKEYIEYDKNKLEEYLNTITEKKLSSKIIDMIIDVYINIRYYDYYEHIEKYRVDDLDVYVKERYEKYYSEKSNAKTLSYVNDALIILRYIILLEKYDKNKTAIKSLTNFENKLKQRYKDSSIIVSDLIKEIKENIHKKEKYLREFSSNDFTVIPFETKRENVYDILFENSVKVPDLFSQVAIDRVFNHGVINEDKMMVYYILMVKMIIEDMVRFDYNRRYLIDFTVELLDKKTKMDALLKIFDDDYLKERIILKVGWEEYLNHKDDIDALIHAGISFAIVLDSDYQGNDILLDIFTYIITFSDVKVSLKKYDNVIEE